MARREHLYELGQEFTQNNARFTPCAVDKWWISLSTLLSILSNSQRNLRPDERLLPLGVTEHHNSWEGIAVRVLCVLRWTFSTWLGFVLLVHNTNKSYRTNLTVNSLTRAYISNMPLKFLELWSERHHRDWCLFSLVQNTIHYCTSCIAPSLALNIVTRLGSSALQYNAI